MTSSSSSTVSTAITDCSDCSVRTNSLFKNIKKKNLQALQCFRHSQESVEARKDIFKQGDKHEYIYSLFSGWGIIYRIVRNSSKRQILRFLMPGDLVGNQLDAKGNVSYSAATITDCVLCSFSRADLKDMLAAYPEIAIRLVDMESRDMSMCQSHLIAAGRKSARESVAYVLMELYYRARLQVSGAYQRSDNTIEFPITQEDIADAVGLTKIHVNRVIRSLEKDGLISCHRKRLLIHDEEKMCEIAEFESAVLHTNSITGN